MRGPCTWDQTVDIYIMKPEPYVVEVMAVPGSGPGLAYGDLKAAGTGLGPAWIAE